VATTRAPPRARGHPASWSSPQALKRFLQALRTHVAVYRVHELAVARAHNLPWLHVHCLAEFAGQPELTVKELTQRLGLSHSRLSHVLEWLEEQELITRRINPADRRIIIVQVGPKARALIAALETRLARCYEPALHERAPDAYETVIGFLADVGDAARGATDAASRRNA
jgi:DNA-binding MarR family transcriptional regulator